MYSGGFAPSKLDYITQQHCWRYVFASDLAQGKRVLDVACGIGYGSHYLKSNGAREVVGVDLTPFAIDYAREHYDLKGLTFTLGDCTQLPISSNSFDIVVSYETIEHIEQYDLYISEVKRVLKKGGLFICSTPNTRYTHYNVHHLKEFRCQELFQYMEQRFETIKTYGQYFSTRDVFRDFLVLDIKKGITRTVRKFLNLTHAGRVLAGRYESLQKTKYMKTRFSIEPDGLDSFYMVRPFEDSGESRLRIMVVVCVND